MYDCSVNFPDHLTFYIVYDIQRMRLVSCLINRWLIDWLSKAILTVCHHRKQKWLQNDYNRISARHELVQNSKRLFTAHQLNRTPVVQGENHRGRLGGFDPDFTNIFPILRGGGSYRNPQFFIVCYVSPFLQFLHTVVVHCSCLAFRTDSAMFVFPYACEIHFFYTEP